MHLAAYKLPVLTVCILLVLLLTSINQERIESLEQELQQTQEVVTQLRHDLSLKSGLLAIYQEGEDESPAGEVPPCGIDLLQKKINELETENDRLKNEVIVVVDGIVDVCC